MASITKRPSGSYQAAIYVGRDDEGKQVRRMVTKPTLKECKIAVKEIERELEDQNYSNVRNIGVVAWIDEWIKLNKTRLSPSTHATYKIYSRVHYAPYFKKMKLKELNEIHIRKFMAQQLGFLSPTTVRKHVSVLNKIFEEALKDKNPARYIKLPSKAKYTPYVLSETEMEKIHDAIRGTRDEIIVLLAAWCGLRRGEIFALKPDDVDWKNKTVRVDENTAINDEYMYVDKGPKSDNGYREVVVPKELMGLLELLCRTYQKKGITPNQIPRPQTLPCIMALCKQDTRPIRRKTSRGRYTNSQSHISAHWCRLPPRYRRHSPRST